MSILLGRLAHSLGYALNHTVLQVADQEDCIRLRRTKTHGKDESKNGANDNWIGRERPHVRDASTATKMLAALGRTRMQQTRIGRRGEPAAQETALAGNTILPRSPQPMSNPWSVLRRRTPWRTP